MKIAIVTGASSGLGREFALQLPSSYELDEIWLIARRKDQLDETAALLADQKGIVMPMSLTSREDLDRLKKKIKQCSANVKVLVNNAGYSIIGNFAELPLDRQLEMIDLNVKTLVELTYTCIPYMEPGSVIYQVASISGFLPGPSVAVYSGTKAFVLNYSHSLYQELKPKNIHVITVSPGAVDTEFWKVASDKDSYLPPNAARAADVVSLAIKDAKEMKLNSTYGFISKMNILLPRVLRRKTLLKLASS